MNDLHDASDGVTHKVIDEIAKIMRMKDSSLPPEITPETNIILSCGIDSIDMLELTAILDQDFGISLDPEEMVKSHYVKEIIELVLQAIAVNSFSEIKAHIQIGSPLSEEEQLEIHTHWSSITRRSSAAKWMRDKVQRILRKLFLSYWSLEVVGEEHLPKQGPFILCANHCSHLDNFALIYAGKQSVDQYVFLAAKDYFFGKTVKTNFLTSLMNLVPFDRSGSFNSFKKNYAYLDLAKQGKCVIVLFPEGTRSLSGKLNPFKPGAALFADYLSVDVIPAYIEGTYSLLPKGKVIPKSGNIKVVFGKPLRLENPYKDPEDPRRYDQYHIFTNQLKKEILHLKGQSG